MTGVAGHRLRSKIVDVSYTVGHHAPVAIATAKDPEGPGRHPPFAPR